MNALQRDQVDRLARCRMLTVSWDRRFVADLASYPPHRPLTPKQQYWLDRLTHRYRKQLKALEGACATSTPTR